MDFWVHGLTIFEGEGTALLLTSLYDVYEVPTF